MPLLTKFLSFSHIFSGSVCTAAIVIAPATLRPVRCVAGTTSGQSLGARLPPLKNAANAVQPAGVPILPFRRQAMLHGDVHPWDLQPMLRRPSRPPQRVVGTVWPATKRAHWQAHQTASCLGKAWAKKCAASRYKPSPIKASRNSAGAISGRSLPRERSPSSSCDKSRPPSSRLFCSRQPLPS